MIFILLIILFVLGAIFSSPKYKGYKGEQKVASHLEKLNTDEYRVINNLLLKTSYGSSQIDHVIVSIYGVFVIETKNYRGWIIGSEYADNWKLINNVDSKDMRKEHVNNVRRNVRDGVNNNSSNNICPRCGGSLLQRNGKNEIHHKSIGFIA